MDCGGAEPCPAPAPAVAQHSPANPARNPSSACVTPRSSAAIPPHLRSLMFLQGRGTAGPRLCYFKGWLPGRPRAPNWLGRKRVRVCRGRAGVCRDARPHQGDARPHRGRHGPMEVMHGPGRGMRGPMKGMCCTPREGTGMGKLQQEPGAGQQTENPTSPAGNPHAQKSHSPSQKLNESQP